MENKDWKQIDHRVAEYCRTPLVCSWRYSRSQDMLTSFILLNFSDGGIAFFKS